MKKQNILKAFIIVLLIFCTEQQGQFLSILQGAIDAAGKIRGLMKAADNIQNFGDVYSIADGGPLAAQFYASMLDQVMGGGLISNLVPGNHRIISINIVNFSPENLEPAGSYFQDGDFTDISRMTTIDPSSTNGFLSVHNVWPYQFYGVDGVVAYKCADFYILITFQCPLDGINRHFVEILDRLPNLQSYHQKEKKQKQKIPVLIHYQKQGFRVESYIESGKKVKMNVKITYQRAVVQKNFVSAGNPYNQALYKSILDPFYQNAIKKSQKLTAAEKSLLQKPTAVWVDTISAIQNKLAPSLQSAEEVLRSGVWSPKTATVTYVHYNLPNRDCHAVASNGQICCSGGALRTSGACDDSSYTSGGCEAGLQKYYAYVKGVFDVIAQHPLVQVVAIIEPDSLPNLATNFDENSHCSIATLKGYVQGIIYSIKSLASLPNVAIYLDAAHSGWLGWCGTNKCSKASDCSYGKCSKGACDCNPQNNQSAQKFANIISSILKSLDSSVLAKIRGFVTNIANYQSLGYPDDQDFCLLSTQYNFAYNELRYIDIMDKLFRSKGIVKNWIVDTGRNGYPYARTSPLACQQWCNIKGKLGLSPTSQVKDIQARMISAQLDALVWIKPPGESDGCSPGSGVSCTRVDSMCRRDCGMPWQKCPSPEAGIWDEDMIKILTNLQAGTGQTYSIVASGYSTRKSFFGSFLAPTGNLVALSSAQSQWSWQYLGNVRGTDLFAWKSSTGLYLSAQLNKTLSLRPALNNWETWIKINKGSFNYWQSYHGTYLSARGPNQAGLSGIADAWQQWID